MPSPGWDALVLHELHAARFTDANQNASDVIASGFEQIRSDLATGTGYLSTLPETTLQSFIMAVWVALSE